MKHTNEEIINALKVIKDECESHNLENCCGECCFHNFNIGCVISEMFPCDWIINVSFQLDYKRNTRSKEDF
jgi:hypothetical protein